MRVPTLLGITTQECKNILGNVVETYSCQGRTQVLEFKISEGSITITPVHDKILSVGIYLNSPPSDLMMLLRSCSGSLEWTEDKIKSQRVTDQFPGYMPEHPSFTYYESLDGKFYAIFKVGVLQSSSHILTIVAFDFQEQLAALPSSYEKSHKHQGSHFSFFKIVGLLDELA